MSLTAQDEELFEGWRDRIETLIREHPLQLISWEATRQCNLRCVHCGSPAEEVDLGAELTADEVVAAFEQIAADFDMSQFRHVNVTGGEPFVRRDLLDILRRISRIPHFRNTSAMDTSRRVASRKIAYFSSGDRLRRFFTGSSVENFCSILYLLGVGVDTSNMPLLFPEGNLNLLRPTLHFVLRTQTKYRITRS